MSAPNGATPPRGSTAAGGAAPPPTAHACSAVSPDAMQKENPVVGGAAVTAAPAPVIATSVAVTANAAPAPGGKAKGGARSTSAAKGKKAAAAASTQSGNESVDVDASPLTELHNNDNANANQQNQEDNSNSIIVNRSPPKTQSGPVAGARPTAPAAPAAKKFVQQTISFGISKEPMLLQQIAEKDGLIHELEHRANRAETELERLRRVQADMEGASGDQSARMARYQDAMMDVMKESARTCRREARRALCNKQFELGQQAVISTPMGNKEVWVHGNAMRNLMAELEQISAQLITLEARKAAVEKQKKAIARQTEREKEKKAKASAVAAAGGAAASQPRGKAAGAAAKQQQQQQQQQQQNDDDDDEPFGGNNENSNPGFMPETALLDVEEELENIKQELAMLKAMETQKRAQAEDGYSSDKIAYLKEKARIQYEDQSDFASIPTIGFQGRYVLMYLLGKGGFSEVWRAFDLHEGRHVACKIHRVRREWNQASRDSYMRHARRELDIQRSLDHPRLTKLYDVFECTTQGETIDAHQVAMGGTTALSAAAANAETVFVSVMEFSAGEDLDTHLKRVRCMPESHARAVFMQIVAGLRHLAELREPIIHYDLKPANIIFHSSLQTCLDVKITDFGLSKIIVEGSANEDGHIEQTSPGAGTYWYLPPECFLDGSGTGNGNQAQMISAKVDIWAAGIILYQMLYGRRPFSHDDSQRRIWQEKLIVQQAQKPLEFPDRPVVSQACKDLIRRCLTYNTNDRPDIFALSNDPYLRMASRRRPRAATPAGGNAGGGAHLAVPSSIAPSAFEFQVPAPPGAKK